ncbi:hypothetical protein BU24DRAFT_434530 [Aaosphaeria arxii CBS 175.79]|uniref:Rhodopsin domain-containing protein n=1 Tax=Aaosphaeria arxii CBS 175.79 TaxID=1450172 RepID=A0A6A5XJQ9_9PLEO|nr:uncharacterized protein BU24DRAFT_434530 [Aaosphaeria arxii CBS 175.79]KAF2013505.1 hypothetical protein BU24DRAFT_434530 [Aaosphaeria arxii CBS 175.79]
MSILQPESGIWYSLCWLVVIARLASRKLHLGSWRRLQVDDYLIVVAMLTDTILMAVMEVITHTSSNLIAPGEDVSAFTEREIQDRIYGSKLVLVSEQMQIITIWLVKACLLLMYYRMTLLLPSHKIVIATAAYVAIGFVVMEILYLGVWCRPFSQYWAVPPSNEQCSAATNHLITNSVLNISSDIIIIFIPMPLLFKVKLPLKNKAILIMLFLIGTFTIVAAALNKYYSFTNPFGNEWTIWYLRESYTALLCANLPLTYPLVQRIFKLKNWSYQSYGGRYPYGRGTTRGTMHGTHSKFSAIRSKHRNQRLQSVPSTNDRSIRRTESEEQINDGRGIPLEIYHNTEVTVQSTSRTEIEPLEYPKNVVIVDSIRKSEESDSHKSRASAKSPV